MDDFPTRLQQLMDQRHWKPIDLVNASNNEKYSVHITKANISQWMHRKYVPASDKLYVISDIFHVNPNYLMCYTDSQDINLAELTKKQEVCDLIFKCYGHQAYEMVKIYLSLNELGRNTAFDRIKELSKISDYTVADSVGKRA